MLLAVVVFVTCQTNDNCFFATPLVSGTSISIDNTLATVNDQGLLNFGGCPSDDGETVTINDIWYTFNSGGNSYAHLSTCDPYSYSAQRSVDTAINVFSGECDDFDNTCVAAGSNNCGLLTSLTFAVTPNTNYYVQIGGGTPSGLGQFDDASLWFELGNSAFNRVCTSALDISTEGTGIYAGLSIGALSDPNLLAGFQCGGGVVGENTLWYRFDSHTSTTVEITTFLVDTNFPITFDTQVFLFEAACNDISFCIKGENDIIGEGYTESLFSGLQKNTTYYVAVSGVDNVSGRFAVSVNLQVEAATCNDAHQLELPSGYIPSSTFYTDRFSTIFINNPGTCGPNNALLPVRSAQWYKFNSGSYDRITIDTCSSAADTELYLTQGDCHSTEGFSQGQCTAYAGDGCPSGSGAKLFNIVLQQHHVYYVILDTDVFTDLSLSWVAGYQAQFA